MFIQLILTVAFMFMAFILKGETAEQIADIQVARAELNWQITQGLGWGQFVGYSTYPKDVMGTATMQAGYTDFARGNSRPSFGNKFITVLNDLPRNTGANVKSGREILIPMTDVLRKKGKVGRDRLQGTGEEVGLFWASVLAQIYRKASQLDDMVALQTINWARSYKDWEPLFVDFWSHWHDSEITRTIYEGYSSNVTDGTFGYGITKRYPKNVFIMDGAGSDLTQVTWSATSATYKSSLITALGTTLGATDIFNVDTLETMEALLPSLNVPFNKDGTISVMITSGQLKTLKQDTRFQQQSGWAASNAMDSQILRGNAYVWGKWRIYVNDMAARIAYASGSDLEFIDASGGTLDSTDVLGYWREAQTAGTGQHAACAIVFCEDMPGVYKANGAGYAVYGGQPSKGDIVYGAAVLPGTENFSNVSMAPTRFQDDYGMNVELGSIDMYGYAAWGFYDQVVTGSTAPTELANQPFAIIATYVA